MQLAHYLGLLHPAEERLADSFREVAEAHAERLGPFAARYGEDADDEPDRLHSAIFQRGRSGPLALLRDLQDLYLMAVECESETAAQPKWARSRVKEAAPQALVFVQSGA